MLPRGLGEERSVHHLAFDGVSWRILIEDIETACERLCAGDTIELPSKLFSLYVSVRSNKARFQGGRGIEGIGIIPHEVLPYDPEDLAAGRDTLIRRAAAILGNFPKGRVPYRPEKQGWKRD